MGLTVTTPPAAEPITTAEAKTHMRIDASDEDTFIDSLITTARRHVEQITRRTLVDTVFSYTLDAFPSGTDPILLPFPNLDSVSSITYIDSDGGGQTWSSSLYQVDATSLPGRIAPAYGESYPSTRAQLNAVTVAFTAGYGAASDVPDDIKHAIKLLVAHWFEHREGVVLGVTTNEVPKTVDALLMPYVYREFV